MFRISRCRTMDIHRRLDRLSQQLGIKNIFPYQLTMFAGIISKTF